MFLSVISTTIRVGPLLSDNSRKKEITKGISTGNIGLLTLTYLTFIWRHVETHKRTQKHKWIISKENYNRKFIRTKLRKIKWDIWIIL